MTTFNAKNKIALVTGANRGIGEGFVKTLLAKGASKIYAAARDTANLVELVKTNPDVIVPIELDVTNDEQISALTAQITDLDLLVNNAGIANSCYNTGDAAIEIARLEMETNYFGPLRITQELLPLLKKEGDTAIINISSIAGIGNFPALGPYSSTKAALHSYTEGLRSELEQHNVTVVGVYPGPTDTRIAEGFEVEKPSPESVAIAALNGAEAGQGTVVPDAMAQEWYQLFVENPDLMRKTFAEISGL